MRISTLSRIVLLFALCITMTTVRAQYVAIPDSNFGNWLYNNGYSGCLIGNGTVGYQLYTSCSAVLSDTLIDCNYSNINDLTGIGYFTSLRQLSCEQNQLTTLPALPSSLTYLDCSLNNGITAISSLPPSLEYLNCNSNRLTTLPTLPSTLNTLYCNNNYTITSLPSLPAGLVTLQCDENAITSLPALPAALTDLEFNVNQISSLPTLPAGLQSLDCSNNQLASLPALPSTLSWMYCLNNHLSSLPALPAALNTLYCNQNPLHTLPALPAALQTFNCDDDSLSVMPALPTALRTWYCDNNPLTSLPALPASLYQMYADNDLLTSLPALPAGMVLLSCIGNPLHSIPVLPFGLEALYCSSDSLSSLPVLPSTITTLECQYNSALTCLPRIYQNNLNDFKISGTQISCLPDAFTATQYDINPSALPLCDAATGCDFYYNLAGTVHYDTAATCTSDSIHPGQFIHNMKVQLLQGGNVIQQFYTFSSGGYSFKTPSLSTFTVDIDTIALPISVACPASGSRTASLSVADTVEKYQSFGMQCSAVDFGVSYIEGSHFRPMYTSQINISAGNFAQMDYNANCGAGIPGTVRTTLTGSVTYASPAPGALTPSSVAGGVLTYNLSNLDSLQPGSLGIIVMTDTNAVAGTDVCVTAIITPSVPDADPSNDTLTQCFVVVHSWDPNEKDVYPLDTFQPGAWLTYTVGFQNTGTDTAYLVVVRDTLSANVNASSFEYLASSSRAVIQLFGNAMVFTFPHINLVDSAANPPLSTGWIEYKVRSLPGLPAGTQVLNTAAVYFDNNPAVLTNTTVNTVGTPVPVTCSDTTITLTQHICQGDTFVFGTQHLSLPGTFSDTLTRAGGCDSIISLTLSVLPSFHDSISHAICQGDTFTFMGHVLTAAGTYNDTLQSVGSCDSIISLNLTINPLPVVSFTLDSMSREVPFDLLSPRYGIWCFIVPPPSYDFPLVGGVPVGGAYTGNLILNDSLNLSGNYFEQVDSITYTYTDSNGCTSSVIDTLVHGDCDGINNIAANTIGLYPNPNHGTFTLQTSNAIGSEYTISDMLGDVIAHDVIHENDQVIDMKEAAEGVYILSVKGANPVRFVVLR